MNTEPRVLFVSGIDTDAGKTYATAWLARRWMDRGLSVATQKFIQTGNEGRSEDIEAHRRLAGMAPARGRRPYHLARDIQLSGFGPACGQARWP